MHGLTVPRARGKARGPYRGNRVRHLALRRALLTAGMLSACVAASPAAAESPEAAPRASVRVKGSDTIGEHLGQALAKAYMAEHAETSVAWESLGSSTAFVGLLDGSADLGASSRAVRASELLQARSAGVELLEYVIGYDGIAVVAHSANPVQSLSMQKLGAIFRGELAQWSGVGGEPQPMRLISRPSYSGTHGFFVDAVVRRPPATKDAALARTIEYVEETDAILAMVSRDPAAISYVGLGFIAGYDVRVLAVSSEPDTPGVLPTIETVRDGSYPIHRPLYVYARADARPAARRLLRFMLSPPGQREVAAQGFVAPDVASDVSIDVAARPPSHRGVEAPDRLYFAFNSTALRDDARRILDAAAARAAANELRIELIGHSDAIGDRAINLAVSRRRAAVVAQYLRAAGVPEAHIRIEARGSDEPIATNTDPDDRGRNRRVDVRLLPR
jgi:phosphate binding protein